MRKDQRRDRICSYLYELKKYRASNLRTLSDFQKSAIATEIYRTERWLTDRAIRKAAEKMQTTYKAAI